MYFVIERQTLIDCRFIDLNSIKRRQFCGKAGDERITYV